MRHRDSGFASPYRTCVSISEVTQRRVRSMPEMLSGPADPKPHGSRPNINIFTIKESFCPFRITFAVLNIHK